MGKDLEDMKLGELLQLEITMASALDCVTKEKVLICFQFSMQFHYVFIYVLCSRI